MNMKSSKIFTLLLVAALGLGWGSACLAAEKSYIVGFKQPPGQTEKAMVQGLDGKVKRQFKLIKAMSVKLSDKALTKLKAHPKVAYIEEDVIVSLVEAQSVGIEYESSWGVTRIGSMFAHDQGNFGSGVKIAVLDTGIDYNHPELAANYRGGDNFINIDPNYHDPFDDSYNSHGTHVAGIIAAQQDGAGTVGVAPAVELYAVKVLGGDGFGLASSIVAGLEWAVANQMNVVNMSIGYNLNVISLEEACQAASDAGLILTAAAGNYINGSHGPVMYPAAYDSVIGVSATTPDDTQWFGTAWGPEVELAAPGAPIYSTVRGGGYGELFGTSQAAPHVAGLAALIISAGITDLNGDGLADHRDVRLQLQNTAYDLGAPGLDPVYGYGLALASTEAPVPVTRLTVPREKGAIANSVETLALANGVYELQVVNHGLANLRVETYTGSESTLESTEQFKFKKKSPQEVSLVLDATDRSLQVRFIPDGKPGNFADVEARRIF